MQADGRWARLPCATITQFAIQNGVGLLSYWALQRDQAGTANDLDRFSRVNTSDYQFYKTLAAAKTATQPVNGSFPAATYRVVSAYDGKCVDINAASTANSAQVQQFTCNGTGAQSFVVSDQGSGWYKILNTNSGKCLDIKDWSTADRGPLQQWTCTGGLNQSFRFYAPGSSTPAVSH